jgi:hypothetical protein
MTAAVGEMHFKRGEARLFTPIWLIVHLTDAMAIAGLVMRGILDLTNDKQSMCFTCSTCPLEILLPIVYPMKLTVANAQIDQIILEVKPKGTTPEPGSHNITTFPSMYHRYIAIIFLQFYEQHRPFAQSTLGEDTKLWPQTFQFAWAMRNAIAHHGSLLNFTNPSYHPVTWNGISYSPADNGKPILGPHFTVGDLLLFMGDFSNELDTLGAPLPPD